MRRWFFLTLALVFVSCAAGSALADAPGKEPKGSARALELRLVAPCCWTQTLDVHESELASALRVEIRERLAHGERPAAIEDDFARRYGERIRAVPKGRDPRTAVPVLIGAGMLLSAVVLAFLARKWTTRSVNERAPDSDPDAALSEAYDGKLDEELLRLDTR